MERWSYMLEHYDEFSTKKGEELVRDTLFAKEPSLLFINKPFSIFSALEVSGDCGLGPIPLYKII